MPPRETLFQFVCNTAVKKDVWPLMFGISASFFVCGVIPAFIGMGDPEGRKASKYINPSH
jgi:hypothetical protein